MKNGLMITVFIFKESELQTDGITFLVDLEDVYMVRKSE